MHLYDAEAARHYQSYRPPLHQLILFDVLGDALYETALDFGCGTGRSTLALTEHCDSVTGVDNSQDMLLEAIEHSKIRYERGNETALPIKDNSIDLVTLAGVVPYLDVTAFTNELLRVCKLDAIILPYDFRVRLEPLLNAFSLNTKQPDTEYDHSKNLSGDKRFQTAFEVNRNIAFRLKPHQAVHLLLAGSDRRNQLSQMLGSVDLDEKVKETIQYTDWDGELEAEIWYALHTLAD